MLTGVASAGSAHRIDRSADHTLHRSFSPGPGTHLSGGTQSPLVGASVCPESIVAGCLLGKTKRLGMKYEHFFKVREKISQAMIARISPIFVFHTFFLQLIM